jgi:peptidoglycan/LPS O-acetylase OafA/YrhL
MISADSRVAKIHGLDLLRGIAALMVCVFHIKKYVWGTAFPDAFTRFFDLGYLGVYVFFVVSGVVIPYSLDRTGYRTGMFLRFIGKRLIRIQPPFLLLMLLLLAWNYGLYEFKGWGKPWLFGWSKFLLNATYLAPFFHEKWVFSIFWTLGVEFQFYLLTGLLFVTLRDYVRVRYVVYALILSLDFAVPHRLETVFHHYVFFAIGFQAFLFHTGKINRPEFVVSVVALLAYASLFELPEAACAAGLTLAGVFVFRIRTVISSFFGDISYSLYLTHGLAGSAVAIFTAGRLSGWSRFGLAICVSLAFATLFHRWVEKPFIRLSQRMKLG